MKQGGDSRIGVLEIRSVRGTGGGPEKTILLGTAMTSTARFDVTVCYIRDVRDTVFNIDGWAREVGVQYVEVAERHSFDLRVIPALRNLIRERRIDIVHAHEHKTDVLAWWLAKSTGVRPLATAHGWTGHSAKERRLYYPLDQWVLTRFPRVIAVSEEIRQVLIRKGAPAANVTTVLNAIDPRAFVRDATLPPVVREELRLPADAFVIGAVGRAEPQKRFDLLIEAFAELAASAPALHLVIAGDGSKLVELQAQVSTLGATGARVHLLGHRSDVVRLHHAFDLFVQASDYEGTPNAVLEAMALESPIVATRAGGTEEIAFDNEHARLIAHSNRQALTAAIGEMYGNPALRRAMAAAARRRVESELSFERRVRKVEAVYEAMMAADPRTGRR